MEKVKIVEKDGKKYIDGEEVLCEYELELNYIKEVIFIFGVIIFYMYMKSKNFDVGILWWLFLFGTIIITIIEIIKDIKSNIVKKIYLTRKHFITANGIKIDLNKIYFKYKSYGYFGWRNWKEILFYKNNKFIFYINKNEDNKEYKKFIDSLIVISGNQDVVKELQRYYAKRKLIQTTGENNGK